MFVSERCKYIAVAENANNNQKKKKKKIEKNFWLFR